MINDIISTNNSNSNNKSQMFVSISFSIIYIHFTNRTNPVIAIKQNAISISVFSVQFLWGRYLKNSSPIVSFLSRVLHFSINIIDRPSKKLQ